MDIKDFIVLKEDDLQIIKGIEDGYCIAEEDFKIKFKIKFKKGNEEYVKITPSKLLDGIGKSIVYGNEIVDYLVLKKNKSLGKNKEINKNEMGEKELVRKKKQIITGIEKLEKILGVSHNQKLVYNTKSIGEICEPGYVPIEKIIKLVDVILLNSAYSRICKYNPQKTELGINYLGR